MKQLILSRRTLLQGLSVAAVGGFSGSLSGCGGGSSSRDNSAASMPMPGPVSVVGGAGTFRSVSRTASFSVASLRRQVVVSEGTITNAGELLFLYALDPHPLDLEAGDTFYPDFTAFRATLGGSEARAGQNIGGTAFSKVGISPTIGAIYTAGISGEVTAYDMTGGKIGKREGVFPWPSPGLFSDNIGFASNDDLVFFPYQTPDPTVGYYQQNYLLYRLSPSLQAVAEISLQEAIAPWFPLAKMPVLDAPLGKRTFYGFKYAVHRDRLHLVIPPTGENESDYRFLVLDLGGRVEREIAFSGNASARDSPNRHIKTVVLDRAGNFFIHDTLAGAGETDTTGRVHHYTPEGAWRATLTLPYPFTIACDPRFENRVVVFAGSGMEVFEVV